MPINEPVGNSGANKKADVFYVQVLLADWQARTNRTPIAVDGAAGPLTIAAITAFQTAQNTPADGRIDPAGPALRRLEELHIQGMRVNSLGPLTALLVPPGLTSAPLPADATPERYFQEYLASLRRELDRAAGPSPVLRDVSSRLTATIAANPTVAVDEPTLGIPRLTGAVRTVALSGLSIRNAALAQADDQVTVTGVARLLGNADRPVKLTVRDDDGTAVGLETEAGGDGPALLSFATSLVGGRFQAPAAVSGIKVASFAATLKTEQDRGEIRLRTSGESRLGPLAFREIGLTVGLSGFEQPAPDFDVRLDAVTSLAGLGFRVSGSLTEPGAFDITPAGALPTTHGLLQELIGAAPGGFPNFEISQLRLGMDFAGDSFFLHTQLAGAWTLSLGPAPFEIKDLVVDVSKASGAAVEAQILGQCRLGGVGVVASVRLPGEVALTGTLPSMNLTELLSSVAGAGLRLPSQLPAFRLERGSFDIRLAGDGAQLSAQADVGGFGRVAAVVAQVNDEWVVLAAFGLAADWTFDRIAPAFAPLNALPIRSPRMLLASFDAEDFPVPVVGSAGFGRKVRRGVTLAADLDLGGGALGFIAGLLGLSQLPLSLNFADGIEQAEIAAQLSGEKVIVPGTLTLRNFGVGIRPSPLKFEPRGEASVEIFGHQLPRFRFSVGVELGAGTPQLKMITLEPWVNPLGIRGLTINTLGLMLQAAPPLYGVLGDVRIGDQNVKVECQFAGSAPTFLRGDVPGPLSLGRVVEDLIGVGLPALLDLTVRDFKILAVAAPTESIDGEHFDPGLALQGTLGIVGLELFVKIKIVPGSGVFAHGSLNRAVNIGGVVVFSNASGDGPPSLTLDTTAAPFLRINARVVLLGLSQSIDATVDRSGFSFDIEQSLGIVRTRLNGRYRSPSDFQGGGSFFYGLDLRIGPLQLAPNTPSLGEFRITAGFEGTLEVAVGNNTFLMKAGGGFRFNEFDIRIPAVSISVAPASLAELPDRLRDAIRAAATDQILASVRNTIQQIGQYLRETVDAAGRTIRETWQRSGDFIREELQNGRRVAQSLRKAAGELQQWVWGPDGALQEYRRWSQSAANLGAEARDLAERQLRNASGQLEKWLFGAGGELQDYSRWTRSALDGAAQAADLAERRVRDAAGKLEKWLWEAGALREYSRWTRSAADGVAQAADQAERLLRDAAGKLERWNWSPGGVFEQYQRWTRSAANGAAETADIAERKLRDAAGQLRHWRYAPGQVLQQFNRWTRSAADGAAQAADLAEQTLRDAGGALEKWLWAPGQVLQEYGRWSRSAADGVAQGTDQVLRRIRSATGTLDEWTWNAGVFQSLQRWSVSTPAGVAQAADQIERQVRDATGKLERWLWSQGSALREYANWWRSTTGGAAVGADLVEMKTRAADGALRITTWTRDHVLLTISRWSRSTLGGAADGADMVEKQIRDAAGKLERTLWQGGAFLERVVWAASAADGAAQAADRVEKQLRDAGGKLERWAWAQGGTLREYFQWSQSTFAGGADAANLVEQQLRGAAGALERWTWAAGRVFKTYDRWWRSAADGAAAGIDNVEQKVRDTAGNLQIWLRTEAGALKEYNKWVQSTATGAATAANQVEKQVRAAAGTLEKWLWSGGAFQQYFQWKASTPAGAAQAADLVKKMTQLAGGQRMVEAWNDAGNYAKSVFDSAGRLIPSLSTGFSIPTPRWPPPWL